MIKKITLAMMLFATFVLAQPTGFSGYSHPVPDFPPNEPTNLNATNGVGRVTLSWTAPLDRYGVTDTDISTYIVQRKTGIGGTWSDLINVTSTSHVDQNNLVVGTTYYYRVRARDVASQNSGYSNEVNGSPQSDTTPPTTPTSFSGTVNGISITLNWTASTDVGGSGVENYSGTISTTSDFSSNNTSFTVTSTTYSFSGNETTLYYFRVRAKDYSGNYSSYATSSATTGTSGGDPTISSLQFAPSFAHGNIITITGNNFGSKVPAAPVLWDDFDDGTNNQSTYTGNLKGWNGVRGNPVYDSSTSYRGLSMKNTFPVGQNNCQMDFNGDRFPNGLYVDFKFKNSIPNSYGRSYKPYIAYGNYGYVPGIHWAADCGQTELSMGYSNVPEYINWSNLHNGFADPLSFQTDFRHVQCWVKYNTATPSSFSLDGVIDYTIDCSYEDGALKTNSVLRTQSYYDAKMILLSFGHYTESDVQNGCPTPYPPIRTDTHYSWFDNIYVDNTPARVEIGNNSIYENCTQREIQIPISWNSNQITATLNFGRFSPTDNLYLFVIDQNRTPSIGKKINDAPVVTGVSGTMAHNSPVTINGSGFGSRSSSGEIVDFINGSISNEWDSMGDMIVVYDGSASARRHANSSGAAVADMNPNLGVQLNGNLENGYVSSKWYASYWFKMSSDWNWSTSVGEAGINNLKWIRFYDSGGGQQISPTDASYTNQGARMGYVTEWLTCPWSYLGCYGSGDFSCLACMPGGSFGGDALSRWELNKWHHIEVEYKDSDLDVPNGVFRIWTDGHSWLNDEQLLTRSTTSNTGLSSTNYSNVRIGMYSTPGEGSHTGGDLWIDDCFTTPTWARVTIGNASTFETCTHRENQKITNWNENEITITLNFGSLGSGTKYLYVIDEEGNVSNGKQIDDGPVVTGVSGTLTNTSLITVSGSGFGSRLMTQQIYDNIEGSTFNPSWSSTGSQSSSGERMVQVSSGVNARHQFSQKHASANFVGQNNIGHATFAGGSNSTQWFCQYWFKLDSDWTWGTGTEQSVTPYNLSNVKIFRLWSTGSSIEDFAVATEGWSNRILVTGENISPSQASYPSINDGYQTQQRWDIGTWHCMQFEFKENSALSVADGITRWWLDGELLYESTTRITRQNNSETKRPYGLGFYNTAGDSRTDPNHVYFDDVFMANTFERVEIGYYPVYDLPNTKNKRELQPTIVSWTPNQIQFLMNQGSLLSGQQVYLYVVNSDGKKSAGFPITIQ